MKFEKNQIVSMQALHSGPFLGCQRIKSERITRTGYSDAHSNSHSRKMNVVITRSIPRTWSCTCASILVKSHSTVSSAIKLSVRSETETTILEDTRAISLINAPLKIANLLTTDGIIWCFMVKAETTKIWRKENSWN